MDEDLTASHWDDILSPSTQLSSTKYSTLESGFAGVNLNSHSDSDKDENDENGSESGESNPAQEEQAVHYDSKFGDTSVFNQLEREQLSELQKEERKEHTSQLLSQLTSGTDSIDLENNSSLLSKVEPGESLFRDKGNAPLAVSSDNHQPSGEVVTSPSKSSQLKNGQFKAHRKRRYPSLTVIKHLGSSQSSDTDPLGPLGAESTSEHTTGQATGGKASLLVQAADAPLYNIIPESAEARLQRLASPSDVKSPVRGDSTSSGVDGNDLEISVGDPVKVGDIATAHIVYAIRTKNKNPSSSFFPNNSNYITSSRRYRDFRWIYHQLQHNHPGLIVPPPPSKQTYIGRFNENFIENRRLSLEKMLAKISKVPALANDPDFVMFLTSEDFAAQSKEREQISGTAPMNETDDDASSTSSPAVISGSTSTGFMSSLFSMTTKVQEPDDFFSKKKSYIDDLEHNLKTVYKSLELIANQRADIVAVVDEIASTIDALADLEILKVTSELLGAFAEVHIKLKENLERVNLQDQLTLGFTIEEYLRIIGSVKYVFETRTNIYTQLSNLDLELQKKQEALDKLNMKYKSSEEKRNMLAFEVDKLKQKVSHFEKSFQSITETIKSELDKFEVERIEDFRNSVEIFIESSIESQKEAIELWETFYERHNLDKI